MPGIKRLDRTEIEVLMIGRKTFRFIRTRDITGHVLMTAHEWSGWTWMPRKSWQGRR